MRVDEFTYAGDPMRIDYAYRRNGTRGFVQALAARARSRAKPRCWPSPPTPSAPSCAKTEFLAVTEVEPRPQENARHRFVTGLLEEREIPVVPLARLAEWAQRMRPALLGQRQLAGVHPEKKAAATPAIAARGRSFAARESLRSRFPGAASPAP